MRDFHMSEDQAIATHTDRAFALAAFNTESNPWCSVERVSPGYIAQEIARLGN